MQVSASYHLVGIAYSYTLCLYYRMKTGLDYINSWEKRRLDVAIAHLLRPIGAMAIKKAEKEFIPGCYSSTITVQRVGANGVVFDVDKIRTMDPETGEVFPHPLAEIYMNVGIDEVVQWRQILDGDMSVVGHRALAPHDQVALYEWVSCDKQGQKLVKEHRGIVLPTRPGALSRTGLKKHADEPLTADECLAMDIEDVSTASLLGDMSLGYGYAKKAARRQLTNGSSFANTVDSGS